MNSTPRLSLAAGFTALLAASLPMLAPRPAGASSGSTPAAVVNQLGGQLQLTFAQGDPSANLVFSPASIGVALAMTSAGADGDTLAQFNDVLGITDMDVHAAMGSMVSDLTGGTDGSFNAANALWLQDGMPVEAQFTSTLSDDYGSEPQFADFRTNPIQAVDAVNGWVADETNERIPTLLSEQDVNELTRFIIANAVYLDAEWASPFEPESTDPDEFTRGDGSSVETDFMNQTLFADYAENDGVQAVTLPYTNGFEMAVVLPPEGGLDDFEQTLSEAGGDLDAVLGSPADTEVELSLPVWDIETRADLAAQLESLGLTLPFDSDAADFSNITTAEPLHVGRVIHEANITVDEAGTEAAAATAVIGEAGAAPSDETEPEPVVMDVDRSFFFAIRDAETGVVVFQGHVNDPSAS